MPFSAGLMTMETLQDLRSLKDMAILSLRGKRKLDINELGIISNEHNKFIVDSKTDFGLYVLNVAPKENPSSEIPGISWPQDTFLSLVRSILVHYHVAFGDYSRIKECQHEDCGHIYFEKRLNCSGFCSKKCRIANFRQKEPRDRLLCRDRQNKWYKHKSNNLKAITDREDYRIRTPYYVSKEDCRQCDKPAESGECVALRLRNKAGFELINKD